jgi:hypothetical protein
MIRPSDQIKKLINEQYKTLDDAHSRLSEIFHEVLNNAEV